MFDLGIVGQGDAKRDFGLFISNANKVAKAAIFFANCRIAGNEGNRRFGRECLVTKAGQQADIRLQRIFANKG